VGWRGFAGALDQRVRDRVEQGRSDGAALRPCSSGIAAAEATKVATALSGGIEAVASTCSASRLWSGKKLPGFIHVDEIPGNILVDD
jgi:hypothetical protein